MAITAAGQRDTRIVFQRDVGTGKDAHGGKVENWQTFYATKAAVRFGSAQERREAAQESVTQSATFRVLANSKTRSLTPLDRIAGYLGSVWDITGVAQFDRTEVEITAVRKAA
jgi:SPP1 family predicted phage head-tail adaptor